MKSKYHFMYIIMFLMFACIIQEHLSAQTEYPFQNPDLPAEERINNIISLLTLEEKISCLGTDPGVPRLGIKGTRHVEGLHGLARGGPSNWGRRDPVPTTIFPQAIGLAESWDPETVHEAASVEGYEVRYLFQNRKYGKGGLVVRAPNADMGRDPRWGRNEECYGEDPYLNSIMTVAFVKGLQGDHLKYWQTASLMKHFLANSNENGRDSSSSDFDERLWREYYAYPFWKGVTEGGSRAYMAAYNAYNGIPCTIHPMLKEITVKEWGQNGIICTDGGAMRLLVSAHKAFPNDEQAAAACIRSGISQFLDRYHDGINKALELGLLTEAEIDSVIKGNFRVMIKLGLLDPPERVPYSNIGITDTIEPWLKEEHRQIVREVTRKTIVLLKNSHNILPVDRNKIKSIAVLGPLADTVLLDWYSGTPPYIVSPVKGIAGRLSGNTVLRFLADDNVDSAVILAKKSDIVIVCAGNDPVCNGAGWGECPTPSNGREAVDRRTIVLEQEEYVKKIFEANSNTVLALISSFPYAINWSQENLPAIVHLTHSSQELGNALADVLFGDFNPAGRLVQTWPKSTDQLPEMMDYNIRHGRTYMYIKGEPLYPFGYGLSYTSFEYLNMAVSSDFLKADEELKISVDVLNTGNLAGEEVIQLYVHYLNPGTDLPAIQLKGFKRIFIKPGETITVEFPLKPELLAFWDTKKHDFMIGKGKIKLMLGSSSKDIRMEKIIDVANH
jgi:beta-glucosidase